MKIIFFGTPEFAVASLEKLIVAGCNITAVVTAPDKERGRGLAVLPTEVKKCAIKYNLPVLQPASVKDPAFTEELKALQPDLFVVVAFRILPKQVLEIPSLGAFNVHGSLLPKYRGAAPIQWSIIQGDTETGVTTFLLDEKVDTGNILLQEKVAILPEDDFGTLYTKMMAVGAELCFKTVQLIQTGNYTPLTQDNTLATPAPKITKETAQLNFNNSAESIHNLIRGVTPIPGAYFYHNQKHYKVFKTKVLPERNAVPGTFFTEGSRLFAGTATGLLEILEIQAEGRKRMNTADFLRGNNPF